MAAAWRGELFWVVLFTLAVAFLLRVTGSLSFSILTCSLVYLCRHLFYINRLLQWLRGGKSSELPHGDGVWEEVYYLVYRVRRRNKRRKKQLIRMLDRFRTATAALPDATVVLGPRYEIDWFNDSASRLLGLRRSDVGQQISNLVRNPRFVRYMSEGEMGVTIEMPSPSDENRELEVRIVPYGDEDFRLMVARDVTELKMMEKVRSDFIANVSHELRTPITVLRGYIEALTDSEPELPERLRTIFRRVEEQTTRMQRLIEGLLVLTRLQSGTHRTSHARVRVAVLIRSVCEEAEILSGFRPKVVLHVDSSCDLTGDEHELRSAFSNLVVNATKYTPDEGEVIVTWSDDAQGARLEVRDNGPGIAPEHLARLTERFYRVEIEGCRNKSGSGLGLAIVKHVLNRHDATLEIESVVGKGSCFACCFPDKRVIRQNDMATALEGDRRVESAPGATDS